MKASSSKSRQSAFDLLIPRHYIIKSSKTEDGVDGRVVSYADEHSYIAEQYRMVRTNLAYLTPDKPPKTILVSSAQAREGKSLTAANLAITLAQDRTRKVLLVDADFRRAIIHTLFGVQKNPGFSDVITGEVAVDAIIGAPARDNLYILPAGASKPNPSELLISTKTRGIVQDLKQRFDFVVFDTPPVLNFTSAGELGSLCDAVILVIKANVTQKHVIREAFIALEEAGAKPKATILTNATFRFGHYPYYYHTA